MKKLIQLAVLVVCAIVVIDFLVLTDSEKKMIVGYSDLGKEELSSNYKSKFSNYSYTSIYNDSQNLQVNKNESTIANDDIAQVAYEIWEKYGVGASTPINQIPSELQGGRIVAYMYPKISQCQKGERIFDKYESEYESSSKGKIDTPWCAKFVSCVLQQSGKLEYLEMKEQAECNRLLANLIVKGAEVFGTTSSNMMQENKLDAVIANTASKVTKDKESLVEGVMSNASSETVELQAGDLVFYWKDGGKLYHVGIVYKVEQDGITVIEGNTCYSTPQAGVLYQTSQHYLWSLIVCRKYRIDETGVFALFARIK